MIRPNIKNFLSRLDSKIISRGDILHSRTNLFGTLDKSAQYNPTRHIELSSFLDLDNKKLTLLPKIQNGKFDYSEFISTIDELIENMKSKNAIVEYDDDVHLSLSTLGEKLKICYNKYQKGGS